MFYSYKCLYMRAYLSIIWNLILSPLFRFGLNKKKENKYRDDGDHRCYCCCRKGDHYRFLVRLELAQRKTHAISCLPYELPLHVIYFIFFLFHISVHDKTKRKILTNTFTLCYRPRSRSSIPVV